MSTAMASGQASTEKGNPGQLHKQPQGNNYHPSVNVGDIERLISTLGGGALALLGLARGGLGGIALALGGGMMIHRGATGNCMMYRALGVNTSDQHGPATSVAAGHGYKLERAVTIMAPPEKLYKFWRNLENLPSFMYHVKSVKDLGNKRSRWTVEGPMGKDIEWEAEIHNGKENELIAWRSLDGSDVDNAGSVHFTRAPGGRGTEVRVLLKYDPPLGKVGAWLATLFRQNPEQQVRDELARFKQLMETGEIATVEGQTSCRNH